MGRRAPEGDPVRDLEPPGRRDPVPDLAHRTVQAVAPRAPLHLRRADLRLDHLLVREPGAVAAGKLPSREVDERVEPGPGHPEGDRGEAAREEQDHGVGVERARLLHRVAIGPDGVFLRDEDVLHLEVVASGRPEAAGVPGVVPDRRGLGEDHVPDHHLAAFAPQALSVFVGEHRESGEPGRVGEAARERPAAGHAIAVRHAARERRRRRAVRNDRARAVPDPLRRPPVDERGGGHEHRALVHAPAGARVGVAERLDHREIVGLGELPPTERARDEHVEQARVGEGERDLRGELALLVHVGRLALDQRNEGAGRLDRRPLAEIAGIQLDRFFDRFHVAMLHRGRVLGANVLTQCTFSSRRGRPRAGARCVSSPPPTNRRRSSACPFGIRDRPHRHPRAPHGGGRFPHGVPNSSGVRVTPPGARRCDAHFASE